MLFGMYFKKRVTKTVPFGPHSVKVTQQAYWRKNNPLHFRTLISQILFGENYSKMEPYIIYKTSRVSLFAISPLEQAKNIFTVFDDCTMKVYIKNNININNNNNNNDNNNNIVRYCAAGKVGIQDIVTHVGIVGYVLSVVRE